MSRQEHKILMIAYKFPPIKSIGAVRNYSVAQQLTRYFKKLIVITTRNRSILQQEDLPCQTSFNTHVVFTLDYKTISRKLFSRKVFLPGNTSGNPFILFLLKLKDSFPFNLLLEEGGLFYIIAALIRARKLIRQENIGYVYSSFRPYSDHLVAYLLKWLHPSLFWIADFRDPHVDLNRNNVYFQKFQQWCNKRIISRADCVTTVSRGLAAYMKRYKEPVYVLGNGINPVLQSLVGQCRKPTQFTIAYTGSIYKDKQNAELVFEAIKKLIEQNRIDPTKISLKYAGKDKVIWDDWVRKYELQAISDSSGQLNLKEALGIQNSSHINLLLSWSGPFIRGILTGKLYEYLAARKPILTLINGDCDPEFEDIFRKLNAGLVAYKNSHNLPIIMGFIFQLYREWEQKGEISNAFNEEALKEFYWDEQMKHFMKYLGIYAEKAVPVQ